MNKRLLLLLLSFFATHLTNAQDEFIARQGQVSFFSYASVENIEAQNNQVLSILDVANKKIAVSMLMRAFVFKKDLMYEHFNESYVESDIYPKATFEGHIIDFDTKASNQVKIIEGNLNIHGITKKTNLKATISKDENAYLITGEFVVLVNDFDIKIPPVLTSNIAKSITLKFTFQYQPYEE